MDAFAVLLASGALLSSVTALVLALGVAVRIKRLEDAAMPPRMGLPVGAPAPREPLTDLLGDDGSWLDRSVLLFASAHCEPCRDLAAALSRTLHRTSTPVILIEPGPPSESLIGLLGVPATRVLDETGTVRSAFKAHATPHAFLVRDGRIRDQQLGADVDRVLSMFSDDPIQVASAVGAS